MSLAQLRGSNLKRDKISDGNSGFYSLDRSLNFPDSPAWVRGNL
jgi:hypothetical protein